MLKKLKRLLNKEQDTDLDTLLADIIAAVTQALKNRFLEGKEVPVALEHVVIDVSAARFNRISAEGMTSQSQEGETLTFIEDDFSPYLDEINGYLRTNAATYNNKGIVRFL